jgi:hypothetical protein
MQAAIVVPIAVALIGGMFHIGAELIKSTGKQLPAEKLAQVNIRNTDSNASRQPISGSTSANSSGKGAMASGSSFDRACAAYAGPEGANSTCSKAGDDGVKGISTYAGPKSANGNNASK